MKIVTPQTDPRQALITEIDTVLSKSQSRLPWVMAGEVTQQRRVLQRVRDYLASRSDRSSPRQLPPSQSRTSGQPSRRRLSLLGASLSEESQVAPVPEQAVDNSLNQQIVQAVVQDLRSTVLMPLQAEISALQDQREQMRQELQSLDRDRRNNAISGQSQNMMSEFFQTLIDRCAENLTQQVAKNLAELQVDLQQYRSPKPHDPILAADTTSDLSLLTPQERLEQLQGIQAQSDQLLKTLDASINVVFETLQSNLQSYSESMNQGVEQMYSLGQQGEVMFSALINQLASQLGREASSYVQSRGDEPTEVSLENSTAEKSLTPSMVHNKGTDELSANKPSDRQSDQSSDFSIPEQVDYGETEEVEDDEPLENLAIGAEEDNIIILEEEELNLDFFDRLEDLEEPEKPLTEEEDEDLSVEALSPDSPTATEEKEGDELYDVLFNSDRLTFADEELIEELEPSDSSESQLLQRSDDRQIESPESTGLDLEITQEMAQEINSLEANSLETNSLEINSLEANSLETNSLESDLFEGLAVAEEPVEDFLPLEASDLFDNQDYSDRRSDALEGLETLEENPTSPYTPKLESTLFEGEPPPTQVEDPVSLETFMELFGEEDTLEDPLSDRENLILEAPLDMSEDIYIAASPDEILLPNEDQGTIDSGLNQLDLGSSVLDQLSEDLFSLEGESTSWQPITEEEAEEAIAPLTELEPLTEEANGEDLLVSLDDSNQPEDPEEIPVLEKPSAKEENFLNEILSPPTETLEEQWMSDDDRGLATSEIGSANALFAGFEQRSGSSETEVEVDSGIKAESAIALDSLLSEPEEWEDSEEKTTLDLPESVTIDTAFAEPSSDLEIESSSLITRKDTLSPVSSSQGTATLENMFEDFLQGQGSEVAEGLSESSNDIQPSQGETTDVEESFTLDDVFEDFTDDRSPNSSDEA